MAKYKYLDLEGLETFATKINDKFAASAVTVTPILKSGTKIATIKVGQTPTDLYCETNTDTTYTFAPGTNGSFTVTPLNGSAQTISIGKPATAGTADSATEANRLSVDTVGSDSKPVKFVNGVPVAIANELATVQSVTNSLAGKLGKTETAADSNKLGGQLPAYYATAGSVSDLQTLVNNLAGADFLEYKGVISQANELPTSQVKSGEVYIVNGNFSTGTLNVVGSAVDVEPGDLIISTGNDGDDANGYISGADLRWAVVQTNIHNAVSGNNLTSDYLVLGNDGRKVKISGIKAVQKDDKWCLEDLNSEVSSVISPDATITSGDVAFLISVKQDDVLLSGGTCATMARITDEDINNIFS